MRTSNRDPVGAAGSSNYAEQPRSTSTIATTLPREIGKYLGTSSGLRFWHFWVGLAERGQRRVERPPFGLDQIRTRFLCQSRPFHSTSGVNAKATAVLLYLVIWRTKSTVRNSHPESYSTPVCGGLLIFWQNQQFATHRRSSNGAGGMSPDLVARCVTSSDPGAKPLSGAGGSRRGVSAGRPRVRPPPRKLSVA